MGQTPFASLTEIWQLAVADSSKAQIIQPPINVAGSTPGPGKVILPQSMISTPRHSVHKPVVRSGVSKNTLSITRTTAQSEGSVRKNLNLGRGLQTSLIANHIHWDAIYKLQQETTLTDAEIEDSFVKAETEEVANVYADCINEISLGGDSQFVPEFFDLTKTEKMEKIVSWIGEKDFVYVEKKTNRQGQVEKFCTVSTLKDFSKIAIQYNPTTEKVVLTSTVTTSDLFESVKKTIKTRLQAFCDIDPSLDVNLGQNIGTTMEGNDFEHVGNSLLHGSMDCVLVKYVNGDGVAVTREIHNVFTQMRPHYDQMATEENSGSINFLSKGDTIVSRLEHQKKVDLKIIDNDVPEIAFQNAGITKENLKESYTLAHDNQLKRIQDECNSLGLTLEEKLAQFKVNNVLLSHQDQCKTLLIACQELKENRNLIPDIEKMKRFIVPHLESQQLAFEYCKGIKAFIPTLNNSKGGQLAMQLIDKGITQSRVSATLLLSTLHDLNISLFDLQGINTNLSLFDRSVIFNDLFDQGSSSLETFDQRYSPLDTIETAATGLHVDQIHPKRFYTIAPTSYKFEL